MIEMILYVFYMGLFAVTVLVIPTYFGSHLLAGYLDHISDGDRFGTKLFYRKLWCKFPEWFCYQCHTQMGYSLRDGGVLFLVINTIIFLFITILAYTGNEVLGYIGVAKASATLISQSWVGLLPAGLIVLILFDKAIKKLYKILKTANKLIET